MKGIDKTVVAVSPSPQAASAVANILDGTAVEFDAKVAAARALIKKTIGANDSGDDGWDGPFEHGKIAA